MKKLNPMTKNQLFWMLQIVGWTVYILFHTLINTRYTNFDMKDWMLYSVTFIIGIIITIGLRFLYRMAYSRFEKLYWLPIFIVLGSTIATVIWYFSDIYFSHLFWVNGEMELLNVLAPMYIIRYNYLFAIILTSWSALYFSIKYAWDWQAEKAKTLEAQMMAQDAQMQMLRYQLNPHFLFNSLNSIRALVDENQENAKEMITELSEFLRYSLLHKNTNYVPLSSEVEAMKHYFSIEKKRFEEKLDVKFNIDQDVMNYQVPSFILHPIIENAVKYGMQTSTMPLRISLKAKKKDTKLILEIKNTGHWIDRTTTNKIGGGTGTGLRNVKDRLENAYGKGKLVDILKDENSTCVRVTINDKNRHL